MKKKNIANTEQKDYEMKRKKQYPSDEKYPSTEQHKDKSKTGPVKDRPGSKSNTKKKESENKTIKRSDQDEKHRR